MTYKLNTAGEVALRKYLKTKVTSFSDQAFEKLVTYALSQIAKQGAFHHKELVHLMWTPLPIHVEDLISISTASNSTVAPCPFCQEEFTHVEHSDEPHGRYFFVHCESCDAKGPTAGDLRTAVELWND